jgi:hypothetical protein
VGKSWQLFTFIQVIMNSNYNLKYPFKISGNEGKSPE